MAGGGLNITRAACDGNVLDSTDIVLDYMEPNEWTAAGHGDFGGHEHSIPAPSAWCDFWGFPKVNGRCGIHPSIIHINRARFDGYGSDTTRVNFLVHETSHSFGFFDYCGVDAITNNLGTPACTLPSGYAPLDRQELRDHIYPNYIYK